MDSGRTFPWAFARLRRWLGVALAVGGTLAAPGFAAAQQYPVKPIVLICAHAPGGAADQLSRIVAEGMRATLGQPVVVENRPGASTMLAAEAVARAPADGYTILMATVTTLSINPSLHRKLRYDPVKDFAPISVVASTPFFLGVNAQMPIGSVRDLVQAAKQKPGSLNYGSSGVGTSSHLAGALFTEMADVNMVHVPYKATSTRNSDLSSGVIQTVFGNDLLAFAKTGKVRILGVTSDQRLSGYPDIPTVAEAAGLPGYEASVWYGLVAPAQTPPTIIAALHGAVKKALAQDGVRQQIMTALGGEPVGSTPEAFAKVIAADLDKWAKVIQRAGIAAAE